MKPINRMLVAFAFVLVALNSVANNYSNVAVNGELLTRDQLYVLQVRLGTAIPDGNYLFDNQGCWLDLTTNVSGCIGSTSVYSRDVSDDQTVERNENWSSSDASVGTIAARSGAPLE
ncbi:MAG: hypothetical protein O7B25_13365 [Gammaproteobacteria bacterium]|nr:hypothetical protein [Gammaproteobacteria bacterium]